MGRNEVAENGSSVTTGAVYEIEAFPFTDAKPAVIGRGGARNLAVHRFCTMAADGILTRGTSRSSRGTSLIIRRLWEAMREPSLASSSLLDTGRSLKMEPGSAKALIASSFSKIIRTLAGQGQPTGWRIHDSLLCCFSLVFSHSSSLRPC